ncbi:membrane associated rhomboid family serine protease [Kerstersia gyiorum]|uniref:Membrane associated rhomboid family serine protease n=1 Tax=Kerstersia gyiorum TaxID=206506 RepID=A0A4Q7MTW4_9BURK|nr:rhomboid family intramembrane serine protease [Kerstersia gyiorum]KAB0543283.1 rhomboid family intramembrane serine protease [Kerstersia gyiorum]RZS70402.1 membrane associated rhomboid family serine protease [Kerstersia gyiorum]
MQTTRSPYSPSFPWPTAVLIAINVVLYLLVALSGGEFIDFDSRHLQDWGGNLSVLTLTGDYWRLLSNMFLHGGLMHLVANMYMLMIVGPLTEQRLGRPGMLVIYLIGGLWASFSSAAWNAYHLFETVPGFGGMQTVTVVNLIVSVGASGAIMALCGGLLASALASKIHTPEANSRLFKSLFQVVAINIVLGLLIPGIDQLAHIGGLLAGFALGLAIGSLRPEATQSRYIARSLLSAAIVLILLALALENGGWEEAHAVRAEMQAQQYR